MAMAVVPVMAFLALAGPPSAVPEPPQAQRPDAAQAGFDATAFQPIDADIIDTEGYLVAHPDQRFRLLAMEARRNGRFDEARVYFRRAARFADKLSQGALAELYWSGDGGERDRAMAYAWMDLAAERGAPLLLAHRERYWGQMTQGERDRAIREGARIHAEYGDAAAKPRLERKLAAARRRVTGSRVGWVGNLSICLDPSIGSCGAVVTGEQYYADRYWKPTEYWAWQDRILLTPKGSGDVNVGPVEPLRPTVPDDDTGK